jgi:hypothetical protein
VSRRIGNVRIDPYSWANLLREWTAAPPRVSILPGERGTGGG